MVNASYRELDIRFQDIAYKITMCGFWFCACCGIKRSVLLIRNYESQI